jgi:hypothetical protein
VRPHPGDLDYARGAFPTAFGPLDVAWIRVGEEITVEVHAPDGIETRLAAPAGYALADGERGSSPRARYVKQ